MKIPAIKVKVRWSDLDANMHLANSSYMSFTSFARVERMKSIGITMDEMNKESIGPVIFHESFSFFKEIKPHQEIYVTTEITGLSEDGDLFEFSHGLYSVEGKHLCNSSLLGTWINFKTRSRAILPEKWTHILLGAAGQEYRKLTIQDIKDLPNKPKNIEPSELFFFDA